MRVIFDTDIGDDIDDVWALGLLLSSKEISLELVSVCFADVESYKIKFLEYMLSRFGRNDIPVAAGRERGRSNTTAHRTIVAGIPDKKHIDAVSAIKRVLDESDEKVYIVADGPLSNLADFASAYPGYKDKYEVVAMSGAYEKGYINQNEPGAEFNVLMDVQSANVAFEKTNMTIMPLDVCRDVIIDGERYERLLASDSVVAKETLEAYFQWQRDYVGGALKFDERKSSSILYDVVPVHYLVHPEYYSVIRDKITATEDGRTIADENGNEVGVALGVDRDALLDFVTDRLSQASV